MGEYHLYDGGGLEELRELMRNLVLECLETLCFALDAGNDGGVDEI